MIASLDVVLHSYYGHTRPPFAERPHFIFYPSEIIARAIFRVTHSKPAIWPMSPASGDEPPVTPTEALSLAGWTTHAAQERLLRYCDTWSGYFQTNSGLICDSAIDPTNLARLVPPEAVEALDLWKDIPRFVDEFRWLLIPDQHGVTWVFVCSGDKAEWVDELRRVAESHALDWCDLRLAGDRVECHGFLTRFRISGEIAERLANMLEATE